MAAAYAALVSLSHILHQIQHPPPTHHFTIPEEQIESLQEQVSSLINFLENYSSRRNHEIEDLENRIVAAVYQAEDAIESYVVRRIQTRYSIRQKLKSFTLLRRTTQMRVRGEVLRKEAILEVVQKLISVGKELDEIKDARFGGSTTEAGSSSRTSPLPGGKNIMVGFDEHFNHIRSALASYDTKRMIVPIVGMGGIGKTTLAANVYVDPYIVETFFVRAWVSVSQEYKLRDIMMALLQQINSKLDGSELSADKLGVLLHKELFGRKYLIVLDDMWEFEAWEKLKNYLPDNGDGSRILVTTRNLNLAREFDSCSPHQMSVLDEEKSWDLIYEYVKEDCPAELQEIGKRIARGCGGLPLALVVIGGLLAKSEKTRDFWEYVNENVTSTANNANDEQCIKILRLSYGQLPVHLKPCFLYLAVFPKNFEIRMSRLIRLWVAEGFIKESSSGESLEEVAEGHLKDLIDRNLVMISKRGHSGKVKTCNIHDFIRDICRTEVEKSKFVCIANLDSPLPEVENELRRLSIHNHTKEKVYGELRPGTRNRSFLNYSVLESRRSVSRRLNLLRVLDVADSQYSMKDIIWLINSRYITCAIPREFYASSAISLLWNLQTLVFSGPISLPSEFWQMSQLRHLKMPVITLAGPPPEEVVVLENLQTLTTVKDFVFSKNVVQRLPHLKKLGIDCEATGQGINSFGLSNIAELHKLESLVLKSTGNWRNMAFPDSLTKLALSHCQIPWEDMSVVGSLPNLVVLKLRQRAATGKVWKPKAEGFRRLKFLLIDWCQLEVWEADETHFPLLERLQLIGVKIEEFPNEFSQIEALRTIDLNYCSRSLFLSAKNMSHDREDYGYEDIQIRSFPSVASRSKEKDVVGFATEVEILIRRLLKDTPELDVISIIGMPGLGKTTVAQMVFTDPSIMFEFPIRVWVEVSPEFSKKNIFLSILREFFTFTDYIYEKDELELATMVRDCLYRISGKFLIVMDDVRTVKDWDILHDALPSHTLSSKVLITSRQEEVGTYANRRASPHMLRFLTLEESLLLLALEVLGKSKFPPEVETEAGVVASQCGGLPLAIVFIGGILANKQSASDEMSATRNAFQQVCERFSTFIHDDPWQRMNQLMSLCYRQLPTHLKKCFLFLGLFPESFEIPAGKLTRLWIAEGLIQQEDNLSPEETAEKYLDHLIYSNLLRVNKWKADGKVKTCHIHNVLHDFCTTQARNEGESFFQEIKIYDGVSEPPVHAENKYQRLCIHSNVLQFLSQKPYGSSVCSFVCFSKEDCVVQPQDISAIPTGFKQLQVLDIMPLKVTLLPNDMYQLLHLRYFALSFESAVLPAAFSKFRNLQTLVVHTTSRSLDIKADILNMIELRHFKTNATATLPKPGTSSVGGGKIQTLGTISPESCSKEVFDRARNLKKLCIRGKLAAWLLDDMNKTSFDSLGKLENLEKLKLMNDVYPLPPSVGALHDGLLPADKFPIKLRSLTLYDTYLDWKFMTVLGSLENLEVLKLKERAFMGRTWEATDGGFPHLQVLHIEYTDLVVWEASHNHFPRLKSLELRRCERLLGVPLGLADVPNFQQLGLYECTLSAVVSARKIEQAKKQQEDGHFGNRFHLSTFHTFVSD